jgi:hypothetical protein
MTTSTVSYRVVEPAGGWWNLMFKNKYIDWGVVLSSDLGSKKTGTVTVGSWCRDFVPCSWRLTVVGGPAAGAQVLGIGTLQAKN